MVADTASASSAAMALATLDQVSERMPPASTIAAAQATTTAAISRSDWPSSQAAGVGGKARLGRQQQQDRHRENRRGDDAHDAAVEAAAEKRRHRVGAELAQERREQHRP